METNKVWYVNVYGVVQCYGGGEEGGWYYSQGTFLNVEFVSIKEKEAHAFACHHPKQLMIDKAENKGIYHEGHGAHDGVDDAGNPDDDYLMRGGAWGYEKVKVIVQDHPGVDFPRQRPRYE